MVHIDALVILEYTYIYTHFCLVKNILRYTLPFAENFLMLHAKLSYIHILQGIFAIYSTYIHIGKAFCYLFTQHTYILARHFCYLSNIYTYWQCILLPRDVHTLERQLHAIYSHIYTFIWKAIFMLPIHIFERRFHVICLYFEKHFRAIINIYTHFTKHLATYSTYVRFIWKVFAPRYLFYIYMYMVKNIFTQSKCKEIIMMQPKPSAGLKWKPHRHALIFMPSCIQNQKTRVPRPKSYFWHLF